MVSHRQLSSSWPELQYILPYDKSYYVNTECYVCHYANAEISFIVHPRLHEHWKRWVGDSFNFPQMGSLYIDAIKKYKIEKKWTRLIYE